MSRRAVRALVVGAGALLGLLPSPAWTQLSNRELVELTDISGLGVSPDGRFAVFRTEQGDVARNSYILRWHSVDLGTGLVRDIGGGGDPIYLHPGSVEPGKPRWAGDGRTIVFSALVNGAVGLWRADVSGERSERLVVRDSDIEEYSLTDGGRAVLYTTGPTRDEIRRAEEHEYDSGILADSSVDLSQNLFRGGSINGRMASQRLVGFWFIRDGLLWRSPRQQHRLDLASGADAPVGKAKTPPSVTVPATPSPLEAHNEAGDIARANWDGTEGSLTAVLSGGRTIRCTDPICNSAHISWLLWRPRTSEVLVMTIDRTRRQSLYRWATTSNAIERVTNSDGLLSGGRRYMVPCAASDAAAICVAASAASPPRLERIDLGSGERRMLYDPNSTMREAYRPAVRFLNWSFGGGRQATGVLMLPARASGPAPLYLNYYLCEGFLRGGEGDEWPVPQLLQAGFAVACINSVPSPGPQNAVADDRIALEAVRTLIAKLASEGIVDPAKVAMGGLSHGSEIAMWVATHSSLLAAVSISSGQLEPSNYWDGSVPGSDQPAIYQRVWGLGAPDETPAQWKRVSSVFNLDHVRSPILFQLPEQEARRIPELYGRLVRSGVPSELYAFPDEDHIKVQPRHRLAIYDRNLDWFRYWLQDYRDPDPMKADQYRRWGQMKTGQIRSRTGLPTTAAKAPVRPSR